MPEFFLINKNQFVVYIVQKWQKPCLFSSVMTLKSADNFARKMSFVFVFYCFHFGCRATAPSFSYMHGKSGDKVNARCIHRLIKLTTSTTVQDPVHIIFPVRHVGPCESDLMETRSSMAFQLPFKTCSQNLLLLFYVKFWDGI